MTLATLVQPAAKLAAARRRNIADLLAPLDRLAATSPNLVVNHDARFEHGETEEFPVFRFFNRSDIGADQFHFVFI